MLYKWGIVVKHPLGYIKCYNVEAGYITGYINLHGCAYVTFMTFIKAT